MADPAPTTDETYDAIVVGARCAGSPTAMLLARAGHRVLVVDRATFPSDTTSTHVIHPPGVQALVRWGLLERLIRTGCPQIATYSFDFGPFVLTGAPGGDECPVSYAPRRTILDKLLVDAAVEAGADVREGVTVTQVLTDDDGKVTGIEGRRDTDGHTFTAHAPVVVGADGRTSVVAKAVEPETTHAAPQLAAGYFAYFRDLPLDHLEAYVRPGRFCVAIPTHDDLSLIFVGWPRSEFEANRQDLEASYLATIDLFPDLAERVRRATRVERIVGTSVPNFVRVPFGPGWALVGDAGYCKDPITAQGITDAFRDAELCATAIHEWLADGRPFDDAMADYQRTRDEKVLPMFELTCQLAALEPPPAELAGLLAAAAGQRWAMDQFVQLNTGVVSPVEFFSEQNVGRIMAGAEPDQVELAG